MTGQLNPWSYPSILSITVSLDCAFHTHVSLRLERTFAMRQVLERNGQMA